MPNYRNSHPLKSNRLPVKFFWKLFLQCLHHQNVGNGRDRSVNLILEKPWASEIKTR